jgi:hypothetical protein
VDIKGGSKVRERSWVNSTSWLTIDPFFEIDFSMTSSWIDTSTVTISMGSTSENDTTIVLISDVLPMEIVTVLVSIQLLVILKSISKNGSMVNQLVLLTQLLSLTLLPPLMSTLLLMETRWLCILMEYT